MGEHHVRNVGVVGSNPIISTTQSKGLLREALFHVSLAASPASTGFSPVSLFRFLLLLPVGHGIECFGAFLVRLLSVRRAIDCFGVLFKVRDSTFPQVAYGTTSMKALSGPVNWRKSRRRVSEETGACRVAAEGVRLVGLLAKSARGWLRPILYRPLLPLTPRRPLLRRRAVPRGSLCPSCGRCYRCGSSRCGPICIACPGCARCPGPSPAA